MSRLQLSFAFGGNPRSRPLISGAVQPEGLDLIASEVGMSDLAWRQFGYKEFDVSELSISSLIISRSHGDDTWVAIPAFTMRSFFHTRILIRDGAGIDDPSDLAGKRIGVPEYQQTAALWGRGALQHEWGVDPKSVKWFMERLPERSHGGATGFNPKEIGIDLTYIPATSSIGSMLQADELDAALLYISSPNLVDRSSIQFGEGSKVHPLFPDARAEAGRYFQKTGLMPVNHGLVVKREIIERHPWVALNLYNAFMDAKATVADESNTEIDEMVDFSALDAAKAKAMRADPFPYGVIANRTVLETLADYSYEQGLSSKRVQLEDLFYPATLHL
jgi:4,5-dihydroxyphthalate decarboxylase